MPQRSDSAPTLIEAVVLGLLLGTPQHGFELAKAVQRDGRLGEVVTWHRPVVYRALKTLKQKGLVTDKQSEMSQLGPSRTIVQATPLGNRVFEEWLDAPVLHLRDVRLELLVKLSFHEHLGLDVQPFITRQLDHFRPIYEALHASQTPTSGVEQQLVVWRKHASRTVMRFLEELQRV